MTPTRKAVVMCVAASLMVLAAGTARADWDPGDGHKMHFPQLPDPFGWDVRASLEPGFLPPCPPPNVVADDWLCTETGPVDDVHIWGSWRQDNAGQISNIHLSIHDNILATAGGFSMPGALLWEGDFGPSDFIIRDYGAGDQGWYSPSVGEYIPFEHALFHQINIVDIPPPFIQQEGTVYWLDVSVATLDPVSEWGWKTSLDHWNDDAVWSEGPDGVWQELLDPMSGGSLDMAFVITPEPATLGLLIIGGLAVLRRQR